MKRHHKLLVAGVIVFLLGWLAWSVLLTEDEVAQPPIAEQAG